VQEEGSARGGQCKRRAVQEEDSARGGQCKRRAVQEEGSEVQEEGQC
jgi:hypothetical protein